MSKNRQYLLIGVASFTLGFIYNMITQRDKLFSQEAEDVMDYHFNEEGILVHKETGKKFEWKDQEHYEKVSEYLNEYLEKQLLKRGMEKVSIRTALPGGGSVQQSYIFVRKTEGEEDKRTLVLVPGSGRVMAGIWSRAVCINDGLVKGSMIPAIDKAISDNRYGDIVVLNPNKNLNTRTRLSHEEHVIFVWDNFLKNYSNIYFVGHSYGGVSLCVLLQKRGQSVMKRVKKIGVSDSVHWVPSMTSKFKLNSIQLSWLLGHSRNWVRSKKELGEFIGKKYGMYSYSAGTEQHEYTPYHSEETMFKYFDDL